MENMECIAHAQNLRRDAERLRELGLQHDAVRRERQAEVDEAMASLSNNNLTLPDERS
jgi:hypothetical protein